MECNNNVIEGSLEQVQESVEYVKSKIGNMVPQLGKLIELGRLNSEKVQNFQFQAEIVNFE